MRAINHDRQRRVTCFGIECGTRSSSFEEEVHTNDPEGVDQPRRGARWDRNGCNHNHDGGDHLRSPTRLRWPSLVALPNIDNLVRQSGAQPNLVRAVLSPLVKKAETLALPKHLTNSGQSPV
jgi:hypothetical protein